MWGVKAALSIPLRARNGVFGAKALISTVGA